jgi:TonB-linked SusC/RagA family outer membrane protein
MRKLHSVLVLTLLLFVGIPAVFAQSRVITGKILDSRGQPVVGATVTAPGSQASTLTNSDGVFSITVPGSVQRLRVSSVGFSPQELSISGQNDLSITLQASASEMSEVVVTALGLERNRRSLQASVTNVNGENFTQAREISVVNALAGRVAGVNVTKVATGPGGSSRVVIRGAKTLGSTLNQPLYVVDGVPMDNSNQGQSGLWGGADQGDAMNSINPDDIASVSILKGASAAALYGSRAANGVILITTKRGSARKGLGIEFNSNYVIESVQDLRDFQTTHGSGGYVGSTLATRVAKKPETLAENFTNNWSQAAWGPKFDGSPSVQFDGVTRPYAADGDNWKRFYKNGYQVTNSIALTGGSETQNFRLSFADLRSKGVFPNSGFDRFNATLSTNSKIGNRLTVGAKVLYSNEKAKNRPNLSDSPGNANLAVYYTPLDVNIDNMIGDPDKPGAVPSVEQQQAKGITIYDKKNPGEEFSASSNIYTQNPWWASYQYQNNDIRDRIITTGDVRYNITNFLYLQGQAGMDYYTLRGTRLTAQGTSHQRGGSMTENENRIREINFQYMVGFNKTFMDRFGVNAFFGGNRMRRTNESISANGTGFSVPFLAAINNAKQRNFGYGYGKRGINSLFGSVELSYNNYFFITGTARKDWFSTLNPEKNSIVYPSIGGSFVFTDAFKTLPSWLNYGKLRVAWAQVGNTESVGAYQTVVTYGLNTSHIDRPTAGFSSGNNLPNPDLVPFTSTEMEYGIEARFFNNRFGLDVTYYDQKTTDDILNAGISQSSGFASTSVNLGKMTNKGIEVLLTGTPIRSSAITWEVSLNLTKNNSKVVSLIEGQKELVTDAFTAEPRTRTVLIKQIVGSPYGMITGIKQKRDPAGNLVYDSTGAPIADNSAYQILGNGVPDFMGGLNNSFTWKGLNLSFLIDFKTGAEIYSGTNVRMTQAGFTKQTLLGRAGEAPLTVTGVTQDGTNFKPFTKTLTPGEARNYWSQLGERAQENFVYDASFIKLRQITLGYSLPARLFNGTPIRGLMVSLVGRNLAILHKKVPNIDPESSYQSGNNQGLDYFGLPASRTYGVNLRATF